MRSIMLNLVKFRLADILVIATLLLATGSASVVSASDAAPAKSAPAAQTAPSGYRLGPDDKIRVIVFDEEQLTGEYFVSAAGYVSLPLIGDLPATGRSLDQFRADVEAAYRKGYLKDPKVAVEVLNYRPFFILGEVNKPGQYPYTNALTVLDAVATAQGFTYRANTHVVFVKHASEKTEHKEKLRSGTPVEPGDTIRIGERFF